MLMLLIADVALAAPPSHPLTLDARPVTREGAPQIDVVVLNPTEAPVWLQITVPDINVVTTAIVDEAGKPVPPIPGPPRGMPQWTHRYERIEPGAEVRINQFGFLDGPGHGVDSARRWDLDPHRGTTLQLTFGFELECDDRALDAVRTVPKTPEHGNAEPPSGVDDIFCGSLAADAELQVPVESPDE